MFSEGIFNVNSGLWFIKPRPDCQFCMLCNSCQREFRIYLHKITYLLQQFNRMNSCWLVLSMRDMFYDFRYIALAATQGPEDPDVICLEEPLNLGIFESLFNHVYGYNGN